MALKWLLLGVLAMSTLLVSYLIHVNRGMKGTPPDVAKLTHRRWTKKDLLQAFEKYKKDPTDFRQYLPPQQNRRYIVVGGSGLVGGWIVEHLLMRGEDVSAIRIADLRPPQRPRVVKNKIQYIMTDVTEPEAVRRVFDTSWPPHVAHWPLTVFHTVAYIKPSERKADFLPTYLKVNVEGTRNVLVAAQSAGCSIFIATSSGSVAIKPNNFFIPPWRRHPRNWVQISPNAEPESLDAPLTKFAGCYPYSKARAEKIILEADNRRDDFRTGVIRPGHAIYGHGNANRMSIAFDYLERGGSPSWMHDIVVQYVSAQNVSLAHLLFESRLKSADIGGNAYAVTDPSPPMTYGDVYLLLSTLAHPSTPVSFPVVPPLLFLLMAYIIETYVVLRHRYFPFLPKIADDLEPLQPSMLSVSTLHLVYDDSRARIELGYSPKMGTLEGLCLQVKEWNEMVEAKLAKQSKTQGEVQDIEFDSMGRSVPKGGQ